MHRLGLLAELFEMLREHRNWILIPPVVALVLVGALIALGQATPLGPLIYPLF